MHKYNYIQMYADGGGLLGGISHLFSSIFGKKQASSTDIFGSRGNADLPSATGTNAINIDTSLTSNQIPNVGPGTIAAKTGSSTQNGQSFWSKGSTGNQIASGIMGGAGSIIGGFTGIPDDATDEQKTVSKVGGVVNGVSSGLMSTGNPALMAVGAGIKAIDGLGGSLLNHNKTATAAKNFQLNDNVMGSASYGGIASAAQTAKGDGDSYRKAGLFAKAFSNTGKIKDQINESNRMQTLGSNLLNQSQQALAGQASSTDLFSTRNIQKNFNSNMWNNGSVTFGKKGTKLSPIHIKKSHEGSFTEYKKRTGKTTEEALHSSDPHVRKMANFAKNAAKWNLEGGTMTQSGSNTTKTAEAYNKLGRAAKQINLARMKGIKSKIPKAQQGGLLPVQNPIMQQDHTATVPFNNIGQLGTVPIVKDKFSIEENPDHGYTKWLGSLPQRLRETNDYDLKGYFDKYGPVNIIGDTHLTDEFKKPNHVTFSNESKYSNEENPGGEWKKASDGKWEFVPSSWNIKNVGLDSLQHYFKENEPSARLVVPTHADGGTINVIAEGKLHAHKHNLKELDHLKDEHITLKGIPVVSVSDKGVIQSAEVERDELILHYDLTKQLELLYKEGTPEAAIQAGRILSKEIVKNTRDSKRKILKNA